MTPSAIAIGIYFCFADAVLIIQCVYYNTLNARRRRRARLSLEAESAIVGASDEQQPLLAASRRRRSSSSGATLLPGSHRRSSVRRDSTGLDPLARMVEGEDATPQRSAWLTNGLSLGAVYVLGVAAWFVSREVLGGGDAGADVGEGDGKGGASMLVGLVLGYVSAVCYLCARIPQIIKNWREKSTEGKFCLSFVCETLWPRRCWHGMES